MKIIKSMWVSVVLAMAGCGGEFDGTYVGGTGFMTVSVMELSGSGAVIESIDTSRRQVIDQREYEAEMRSGKLVLIADGKTFVYARAADEESLECLSDSCQGFGGLGGGGMPRTWKPFRPKGQ